MKRLHPPPPMAMARQASKTSGYKWRCEEKTSFLSEVALRAVKWSLATSFHHWKNKSRTMCGLIFQWWSWWERQMLLFVAQICCNLPFLRWKMSNLTQSPVKQKTSFERQKMAMPILFMVKNGNAFAVYSPKDPANISNGSLFRIPTIFYGFHYHPLPYITITAFNSQTTCPYYTVCPPVCQMNFTATVTFRKCVDASWL